MIRQSAAVAIVGVHDSAVVGVSEFAMPTLAAIDRHVRFFSRDPADVHTVGQPIACGNESGDADRPIAGGYVSRDQALRGGRRQSYSESRWARLPERNILEQATEPQLFGMNFAARPHKSFSHFLNFRWA